MKADVHSHILPGIDDGAATKAVSASLLSALSRQGVTHLALTPHFYPAREALSRFLEKRKGAWERLCTLSEARDFTFSLGCEVYLTETLFNYEDLRPLCYEGTELILTELPLEESFSSHTRRKLLRLVHDRRLVPVLAHVNRYPYLVKSPWLLEELAEMGCLFQWNEESLFSYFSRRRCIRLFEEGFVTFFGGDLHHLPHPPRQRQKLIPLENTLLAATDANAMAMIFGRT